MELLAEGRMAEVYAYGEGTVLKLDRPEWSGVSAFESDVLVRLSSAGLPVARSHGVVTVDGRCGVVLDRVDGTSLEDVIDGADPSELPALAARFAGTQRSINAVTLEGLPDLVPRLANELSQSGLGAGLIAELQHQLAALDDGQRGVCHFDYHPMNVLVGQEGWVVIDWLTVASGPSLADVARTLLLVADRRSPVLSEFMGMVRRISLQERRADPAACDRWIRVLAAARLTEGLNEEYAAWLRAVARGEQEISG